MDRRIVFLRHVSSPHPRGVSDFDRPIDEEGGQDARRIARHLEERDWLPRRVLCSGARRARETWQAVAETVEADFEVTFTDELYAAGTDTICEQIWGLSDELDEVILVGHNPGWSDTVSWLTGVRTRMPKGGAALMESTGESWTDAAQQQTCDFIELVRPYELD